MTQSFKTLAAGLALSVVLSAGALGVYAEGIAKGEPHPQKKECKGGQKGGHQKGDFKKHHKGPDLGLSEDQKAKMKASHEAYKAAHKGEFEAMKANFEKMKTLDKNSPEAQALRNDMKKQREAMHADREASMKAILTPDQQAKMQAFKAERKAKWEQRKKEGGGHKRDGSKAPAKQ